MLAIGALDVSSHQVLLEGLWLRMHCGRVAVGAVVVLKVTCDFPSDSGLKSLVKYHVRPPKITSFAFRNHGCGGANCAFPKCRRAKVYSVGGGKAHLGGNKALPPCPPPPK